MLHFATLDNYYSQDGFRAIKLKFKNDIAENERIFMSILIFFDVSLNG